MNHSYNQINALLKKGLFTQAIVIAKESVAKAPSDAWAWLQLGRVHEAMREPQVAAEAFSKALSLKRDMLEAYECRAQVRLAMGELEDATTDARWVLAKQDSNVRMLLVLGSALLQTGRYSDASSSFRRILAVQPGHSFATVSLAHILIKQGRPEDALSILADCSTTEQHNGQVLLKKAEILWILNRRDEAWAVCREAAGLFPLDYVVRAALGRYCYETGEIKKAAQWLHEAVKLAPQLPRYRSDLCAVLLRLGRIEEAWVEGERAILVGQPFPDGYLNLGNVHRARGDVVTAELCYRRALTLDPQFSSAFYNLSVLAQGSNRFSEAEALGRQSLSLDPHRAEAHSNLGVVLNILGRPGEALIELQTAAALDPDNPHTLSNVLLTALHCDHIGQEELTRMHFSFGERFDNPPPVVTQRRNNGRLRIGYVSCDFRRHSVAYFLQDLWRHHDRKKFQVHAYYAFSSGDDMTERLKSLAECWHDISTLEDAQAAERIRKDRIDILIDLSGHTAGNRLSLFARKVAPIQIAYLGYPATTGLRNMDIRLTDALADPPGQTSQAYTERLEYLPAPFLCYCPPDDAPEVTEPPVLHTGTITFGSFNKLAKLSDTTLTLWKDILIALPQATLRIKDRVLDDEGCKSALAHRCSKAGFPMDRLFFLPGSTSQAEHLAQYGKIDISLDTYPYHGTTTTCEALWMGTPVVTLIGGQHHSRVGLSILASIGAASWATRDKTEYIAAALSLASDPKALTAMRKKLRKMMQSSRLLNGKLLANELEKKLQMLWEHRTANISA